MTVIQTGSIAFLSFLIGDYASAAVNLGAYSTPIYAALVVILLTALNIAGVKIGSGAQLVATIAVVIGLLLVIFAGFTTTAPASPAAASGGPRLIGLAMVFVLLTYGGWNEAAYLSAEVRTRRGIVWALLIGLAIVTVVYVLVNVSMLNALGLSGMANSKAVAAEVMRMRFGDAGAVIVSVLVVLAALTTANGTIITGRGATTRSAAISRCSHRSAGGASAAARRLRALVVQGAIALVLVVFGSLTRSGLKSMIDYITPVFWVFFLLAGISLFVLRYRDRNVERPFRVPLYPVTPLLFCAVCAYMLWSSLNYAGRYSWIGLAVLVAGIPLLLAARPRATMAERARRGFPVEPCKRRNNKPNSCPPNGRRRTFMLKRNLLGCVVMMIAMSVAWSPVRGQADAAATAAPAADAPVKEVKKDVPYVPTPEPVVEKMIELAKVTKDDVAYDFGCGDGRLVIAAAKAGAKQGLGVDIDPERIKEANENAKTAGVTDKVKFVEADLFTMDFKDATVLTMYLLPSVNMKLRPKILDEMKPGSRIVSHAFDMEDWEPEQEVTVEPGGQTVYMWTVPAKVEGGVERQDQERSGREGCDAQPEAGDQQGDRHREDRRQGSPDRRRETDRRPAHLRAL